MLKETLFKGSPDEREEAALALTHVIKLSSVQVLTTKNNVIQIAGPLIRLISDRFGPSVKMATLDALIELIEKVGLLGQVHFPPATDLLHQSPQRGQPRREAAS